MPDMNTTHGQGLDLFTRLKQRPRCPVAGLLGHCLVAMDVAAGLVEVEFQAAPHLFNPMAVMQGGLTMAMLEMAMTDAAIGLTGLDYDAVLLEVNCNFLAAIGPGPVRCRAHLARRGRSTAFVAAQLFDGQGELAATATAVATLSAPAPAPATP